jgi:hypothetical protein
MYALSTQNGTIWLGRALSVHHSLREKVIIMNNNAILTLVIIVLLGVIGYLMYDNNERKESTIGGKINEVVEEVQDEVDDATTDRKP